MVAAHEQPRARGGRGVATALGEHARAARVKVIATTKPSPPPPTAAVTDDAAVRPSPTARHSSICVVSEPGDAHTSRHAWPNATRSITTGTMETASCRTSAPRIAFVASHFVADAALASSPAVAPASSPPPRACARAAARAASVVSRRASWLQPSSNEPGSYRSGLGGASVASPAARSTAAIEAEPERGARGCDGPRALGEPREAEADGQRQPEARGDRRPLGGRQQLRRPVGVDHVQVSGPRAAAATTAIAALVAALVAPGWARRLVVVAHGPDLVRRVVVDRTTARVEDSSDHFLPSSDNLLSGKRRIHDVEYLFIFLET
jgi:hypothetical protein